MVYRIEHPREVVSGNWCTLDPRLQFSGESKELKEVGLREKLTASNLAARSCVVVNGGCNFEEDGTLDCRRAWEPFMKPVFDFLLCLPSRPESGKEEGLTWARVI